MGEFSQLQTDGQRKEYLGNILFPFVSEVNQE